MHLYVTLSDGQLEAKTEVYVNIINSSAPYKPPLNGPPFPGGAFNPFGRFNPRPHNTPPKIPANLPTSIGNINNPPPNIANNPPPMPSNHKPYFRPKNNSQEVTPLRPVKNPVIEDVASNSLEEKGVEDGSGKAVTSKKVFILNRKVLFSTIKQISCLLYRVTAK